MIHSLLLVEDDPDEARRLDAALTRLGYHCVCAPNGDAALALMVQTRFDVVLLDLVLPELDGMGVLAAMAARGIATPVVVQVTAAGLDGAAGALGAGARDFVVKPAGALRLQVALANAIALGRIRPALAPSSGGGNVVAFPAAPAQREVQAEAEASDAATVMRLDAGGHSRRLDQIEAEAIRFACHLYGGRMAEVARRLGIGRSTLYRKLAEMESAAVEGNHPLEPSAAQFVAAE
ncbi:response regulator [Xanthobacter sp. KR7-65]|uniref:response regulator n=1 Tax=Xanthobacter sp. KR7-65 TaxID=3156612 RepID=UPI0032B3EFC4